MPYRVFAPEWRESWISDRFNISSQSQKNLSQPPLSMQIKQLEEDLGAQLFIRGKRKLQLTEAGRAFYRRATQILSLSQDARDEIRSLGNELSGRVRLGIVAGRAPYFTGRWIAGFHEEYPLVTFSVWNGSSDDVIDRLYKGLIDLAVVAAPYDEEHLEGITVGSGGPRAREEGRKQHHAAGSREGSADRAGETVPPGGDPPLVHVGEA